jgi:flagellar biosynthesis chaperone FliJ
MVDISVLESIDCGALIIGVISFIAAYYKVNKQSKSDNNTIIKDYYVSFIDELNTRNKNLSEKINELEKRLDVAEERYQKCMNRMLTAKCVNNKEEGS